MTIPTPFRILVMTGESPDQFRNLRKEKVHDHDTHHCFIKLLRSLSVPSALLQQGQFGVREYSDKTMAQMNFISGSWIITGRLSGELRAGGLFACQQGSLQKIVPL